MHLILAEPRTVDVAVIGQHHRGQLDLLARLGRQRRLGIEIEPDVDIDAVLVRGMAGGHGPAPRPRHVADIERREARRGRSLSKQLDESDGLGVPVIAVPAQSNRLISDPVRRQLRRTRDAAVRGPADDPRGPSRRGQQAAPFVGEAGTCDRRYVGRQSTREEEDHGCARVTGHDDLESVLPGSPQRVLRLAAQERRLRMR